jgi:site-specific recombinase XerD
MNHFRSYLEERGLDPTETEVSELTPALVTDFITWLYDYLVELAGGHERRVSESTKGVYFAALAGFLDYLILDTQALSFNGRTYDALRRTLARAGRPQRRDHLPPDKLPSPEIIQTLREEVWRPLDVPEDTLDSIKRRKQLIRLRNIAIVEGLLSSGMRVGELVRLRRGDLLYEVHGATVKRGKGRKDREVLFSDRAWGAILAYLEKRNDSRLNKAILDLPVISRHNRPSTGKVLPITTRTVGTIFRELADRSGISEQFNLTPHTLRHYFATKLLEETGDLAMVQDALGHSSPNTTRIYAKTKREHYRRVYREVFDR